MSYLLADLDETCWQGRHLHYFLALGLPMLLGYVIGLPLLAYLRVRAMNEKLKIRHRTVANVDKNEGLEIFTVEHRIYGMFYSAFRKETWWWESTVAARKIVIAMIGVFGAEMESMQVHVTIMLVVLIMLATAQVRPFGGLTHGLLHRLEMFSLLATFLTLWAGSVFNTLPRCEDPDQGEGTTLLWCDVMSLFVGVVDILVVVAFVSCFVYLKAKAGNNSDEEMGTEKDQGKDQEKEEEGPGENSENGNTTNSNSTALDSADLLLSLANDGDESDCTAIRIVEMGELVGSPMQTTKKKFAVALPSPTKTIGKSISTMWDEGEKKTERSDLFQEQEEEVVTTIIL